MHHPVPASLLLWLRFLDVDLDAYGLVVDLEIAQSLSPRSALSSLPSLLDFALVKNRFIGFLLRPFAVLLAEHVLSQCPRFLQGQLGHIAVFRE